MLNNDWLVVCFVPFTGSFFLMIAHGLIMKFKIDYPLYMEQKETS